MGVTPAIPPKKMVPTYPNLVYKEGVVALALIAVILVFAVFFNAPLLERANPSFSLNPTKAPWYFAGIQELLMHFHPFFAGFLIPLALIVLIAFIPFLKYEQEPTGMWFVSDKGKKSAKLSAVFAAAITIILVLLNEYLISFEMLLPWLNPVISNGIIPLLIVLAITWGYSKYIKIKYKLSFTELVQSVFVFVVTSFVILTLINTFFRGINMQLTFPWNL